MLRKSVLFGALALFLFSCTKDNSEAVAYYFSAKVNGESKVFNTSVMAEFTGDDTQSGYTLGISGSAGTIANPLPAFLLTVKSEWPIAIGTYETRNSQMKWEAEGQWWVEGATWYDNSNGHDFTITITSITSNYVQGSFSGEFGDGSDKIIVSDGKFTARINQ